MMRRQSRIVPSPRIGLALSAALALTTTTTAPAEAQQRCPSEGALFSQHGAIPTRVTFINQSNRTIQVHWLNYDGYRQRFATLDPGQSYQADTFATHPWVVTDTRGNCLQVVFADRDLVYRHN